MLKKLLMFVLVFAIMASSFGVVSAAPEEELPISFPAGWDMRRHDTLSSYGYSFPKSVMTGLEIMTFWNTAGFTYATGVDREMTPLMGIPWTWNWTSVTYD